MGHFAQSVGLNKTNNLFFFQGVDIIKKGDENMKVLLYTEGEKLFSKSGLGKAIEHQMKALECVNIEYTTDTLEEDYDIIHINFYGPNSFALAKLAKRRGKKIVYHAHSTEEDFKNGFILSKQVAPAFKKWLINCYNLGDVIITPTPYSKKLLENYGIKKKIYAISNGIDLEKFQRNKEAHNRFRQKYHLTESDKVIIGVGLYIERKGIVDFVELAKRLNDYQFIWFGYSPLSATTKEVRDAVNTKLDNLLFAGYVESSEIVDAMNGCDLYLFPTFEETEGIPVIEACACKTPSLIRDIPVFEDWLEDGKNIYKAKTVDEFEEKIKKIINKEFPYLGEEAYKVAQERDIKKIGTQLKKVYEEVLNQ